MAPAPVLTVGLQTVRGEFNVTFPNRGKASDGWIGDLAHQLESSSGHNPDITGRAEYKDGDSLNEVRAIDVDKDLRDPIVTMEKVVQYLVQKARSGAYVPFRYIIYNRRIWRRTNGWKTETYTGPNPHDKHAHFSGDYTQTADNWRGLLGLKTLTEEDMPTADEIATAVIKKLNDAPIGAGSRHLGASIDFLVDNGFALKDAIAAVPASTWATRFSDPADPEVSKQASTFLAYGDKVSVTQADRVITELQAQVATLQEMLATVVQKLDDSAA